MWSGLRSKLSRRVVMTVGVLAVFGASVLLPESAEAIPYPAWKTGRVVARSLVRTPDGFPIYAEYDSAGKPIRDIGPATGNLERGEVLSAGRYRIYQDQLRALLVQYPFPGGNQDCASEPPANEPRPGACLMTVEQYRQASFTTLDGKPLNEGVKPEPLSNTKSLLVRRKEALVTPDTEPVLMQAAIDLTQAYDTTLGDDILSVLVDNDGKINVTSTNNIGFKAAWFEDESESYLADGNNRNKKALGPLRGVVVEGPWNVSGGITDKDGRYSMFYFLPPCPGFTFEYTTNAYAQLHYQNFNPRGAKFGLYYLMSPGYDFCNGLGDWPIGFNLSAVMTQVALIGIRAGMATPNVQTNFYADTVVLTGRAVVRNPDGSAIGVGQPTAYGANVPALQAVLHQYDEDGQEGNDLGYDFDGDGKPETLVRGKQATVEGETRFVADDAGELVGVYLSSGNRKPDSDNPELAQPDFTRLLDYQADFQHQGLLKGLSFDDLKNTDLYVFRESNGQLVTERRGLKSDEFRQDGGVDESKKAVYYRVMIRGPRSSANGLSNFEQFQSASKMNPALYQRDADHLRPGENVRLVLINRATGYIGTLSTPLKTANDRMEGFISFPISDIPMLPPNLKIRAERKLTVEKGLTKGEERDYLIGFEGGATDDDTVVEVTTEWYDANGQPLPEGLKDYGYTGRLAKIVADKQLGPGNSGVATFAIEPGTHRQVLRLKDEIMSKDHFYIHVAGEPKSRNPQFGQGGAGEGVLQDRPTRYVPVLVPVFDEKEYLTALRAWRTAREQNENNQKLKQPKPTYRWRYRPEMQFSVYELAMRQIQRGDADGTHDILDSPLPGVASSDQFVNLVYQLMAQTIEPLQRFSGAPELIFAVGEQEIKAQISESGQLRFDNLKHLASLSPEDYLTMRMYLNNDPGNVLWEYAFEYLSLAPKIAGTYNETDKVYWLTADDPKVSMQAVLVGYGSRDPEYKKQPPRLRWSSKNSRGSFQNAETDSPDAGIFTADFVMPTHNIPVEGLRDTVVATITQSSGQVEAKYGEVLVLPGKPARIELEPTGEAYSSEVKGITLKATVYDAFGNLVTNGTPIDFQLEGSATLKDSDLSTTNGTAKTTILGSNLPSPSNTVIAKAGDARAEWTFAVQPLSIQLQLSSTRVQERTTIRVAAKVTAGGAPVPEAKVSFASNFGRFAEGDNAVTGPDGIAYKNLYTGFSAVEQAKISARSGIILVDEKEVTFEPPVGKDLIAPDAMVVGDRSERGLADYTRFDGAGLKLRFETTTQVKVSGLPNTERHVVLGTLAEPNRAPLAAYYMNELESAPGEENNSSGTQVPDETDLHRGTAHYVDVIEDDPVGVGRSYLFRRDVARDENDQPIHSSVEIPDSPALKPSSSVGFRLDFKPEQAIGELFNLAGGTQRLVYLASGELQYSVTTTSGIKTIVSPVLNADNRWHTIAGRYFNGKLELELDGLTIQPITVNAELAYPNAGGLTLGHGFAGALNSVRWYDWSSAPLLTFDDGSTEKTFAFDETRSQYDIVLKSTGQMNALQVGSAIQSMRVIAKMDDQYEYVGLVSADFFAEFAGQMASMGYGNAPPIEVSGYPSGEDGTQGRYQISAVLSAMIKPANAGAVDWIMENIWDIAKTAIGFVIPFEEAKGVLVQLYNLAFDRNEFDAAALAIDLVGVLTFLPPAKPFALIIKPLRRVYATLRGKPYLRAVADLVAKYADDVMKGRFDQFTRKLFDILPYIITAAEMIGDEEARAGFMAMVDSIKSTDDLMSWIGYLTLPTEGWDEDGEPPTVDLSFQPVTQLSTSQLLVASVANTLIKPAYAGAGKRIRIDGKVIGKRIKELVDEMPGLSSELSSLGNIVKGIRSAMKEADIKSVRKLVHSGLTLKAAYASIKRGGAAAFHRIVNAGVNMRMSPLTAMAVLAFVESRRGANCSVAPKCLDAAVDNEISTLYSKAFGDQFLDPEKYQWLDGNDTGAMFHLAMVAVKQAEYEGGTGYKIVGIEKDIVPEYYKSVGRPKLKKAARDPNFKAARRVDIVLNKVSSSNDAERVLVEVKTYQKAKTEALFKQKWKAWTFSSDGKNSPHREFVLDKVITAKKTPRGTGVDPRPILGDRFEWWFQKFNVKLKNQTISSYDSTDIANVKKALMVVPDDAEGRAVTSLGFNSMSDAKSYMDDGLKGGVSIVNLFSLKTWVTSPEVRNAVLKGIANEIIDELTGDDQ